MPKIYVDDEPFEVEPGQNLLAACLGLGFDIPYFCWHPAMGSVGACRQCAVKQFRDEHDTEGRIVMACLTPAEEGTRISIDDPEARAFRAAVSEWLMASHPHDCPVCDEGGECHLQDMTVMTGHVHRRYRYPKRTHRNQDLGPFLNHEMNRCIQCYRCVRFYADYAGGDDLAAMGTRNHVYFGRHRDGKLESEFSGNLVEVCPTGVFTDRTLGRHYTRKWDLQTAPSVCVHCGLGCNTIPGERYGLLRCIRNRYNESVNGYFLCDRGRYGYEFVNSGTRLRRVVVRATSDRDERDPETAAGPGAATGSAGPPDSGEAPEFQQTDANTTSPSAEAAVEMVAGMIREARERGGKVVGIGSPRASLEANYALRRLVGRDQFYLGMARRERRLVDLIHRVLDEGPSRGCSLRDLEQADAMLILGEDVTNTAPMLDYSLRQWLRRRPTPEAISLGIPEWNDAAVGEIVHEEPSDLHIATVAETKLDRIAGQTYHAAPPDLARLGFAVAHLLDPRSPAVPGLPKDIEEHARSIAAAFEKASRPIVIAGTSLGSEALLTAAANVAWSLHARGEAAELCFVVPECNSMGLALMGGRTLEEAFSEAEDPGIEVAIIVENDLFRRAPEIQVDELLSRCRHVVVVDHTECRTSRAAEVVLPTATFAETTGTLVNNEARAQRHFQVFRPSGDVRESRSWLADIARALVETPTITGEGVDGDSGAGVGDGIGEANGDGAGAAEGVSDLSGGLTAHVIEDDWSADALARRLAEELSVFGPLADVAPAADFRILGMKIPRQSHRFSGRTAMHAEATVFEPRPPADPESPLAFSMEGFEGQPPPALVTRVWAPGWNSVQSVNRFQEEIGGSLRGGDAGVRLLEPSQVGKVFHFLDVPLAFGPVGKGILITSLHHIFGSEELSFRSPSVAVCVPSPYLGIGPEVAAGLHVGEGDLVALQAGDTTRFLSVKIVPSLPPRVAGIPIGLPGLEGLSPPFYAEITDAGEITEAEGGGPGEDRA